MIEYNLSEIVFDLKSNEKLNKNIIQFKIILINMVLKKLHLL